MQMLKASGYPQEGNDRVPSDRTIQHRRPRPGIRERRATRGSSLCQLAEAMMVRVLQVHVLSQAIYVISLNIALPYPVILFTPAFPH